MRVLDKLLEEVYDNRSVVNVTDDAFTDSKSLGQFSLGEAGGGKLLACGYVELRGGLQNVKHSLNVLDVQLARLV